MIKRWGEKGLTLIEILLALIIMVLGIVGILALFPPALQSSKESMEETQAAITAESVAHALSNSIRFGQWNAASQTYDCLLTHDLKYGAIAVQYPFSLPKLADYSVADGWRHHPGGAATTDPKVDPAFNLAGDAWVAAAVDTVRNTNDMSEPYKQFAFSYDVRKINTLAYLIGTPKPDGSGPYTTTDLEPMVKLYEFRIHVFRIRTEAAAFGGTGTGTGGTSTKKLIATVTDRVSTK